MGQKLYIGFAVPIFLIIVVATIVTLNLDRMLNANRWVNHTYQAIDLGKGITTSLINMETGLRGYLVAGKDNFLEPYHLGTETFAKLINEAREKVSDNPKQVALLNEVETLKNGWVTDHVEPAIRLRQEVNAVTDVTHTFKTISARTVGKEKFDGFREELAKIKRVFQQRKDTEAILLIDNVLIDMLNQETGQRGFLLSGKEESLAPFVEGIASFEANIKNLNRLTEIKYPSLKATVARLADMARDWREQAAEPEIKARREMNKVTTSIEDVTAFIEKGIGKHYMDTMRSKMSDFVQAEEVLILGRNETQESTASNTELFTILGALVATALGILIAMFITRLVKRQLGGEPEDIQSSLLRILPMVS